MRNETRRQQDVTRGRNVISSFVPEVGKPQQGQVEQKCEYKDGGKNRSGVGAGPYHPTFGRRVIFQMPSSRSPFLEQETSEASPQTDKHVVTCIGRRIAPVACVELGMVNQSH